MDATLWKAHLRLAEKHVALAERIVATQIQVVAELERDGHSTQMARRLLKAYEDLLELHREDRDRMRKDLESAGNRLNGSGRLDGR